MAKIHLLDKEKVKRELTPHPLSFMGLQSICLFILIWGFVLLWLINSSYWDGVEDFFHGATGAVITAIMIWWIVLLAGGGIASLLAIRWRIFFLYLGILVIGTVLMYWQGWQDSYELFIPIYSILVSIIGFIFVDIYRRSHHYFITNLRLVFRGGIVRRRERTLRYDKITDVEGSQGILGRIFGFGTIIPITQSGFGLGNDSSFAAGGIEVKPTKKVGLIGIAGGGKGVKTPRTRSYYELHGAHPYGGMKVLIEELVQSSTIAPYQREQVDLQKEMVELLKRQEKQKE